MNSKQRMIIIVCILTGCMLLTACRKDSDKTGEGTTETETNTAITPSPAEDTEETANDTRETDAAGQTEPDTGESRLSEKEAIQLIQDRIGERGYYFVLVKDSLALEGNTYYEFQISDGSGAIEPNVLVNVNNGELLCYKSDETTAPFSEHPLYTQDGAGVESDTTDTAAYTREDALASLSKVPKKVLGLPSELSEYTVNYDNWTTNIKGTDCYGVNVYSEKDGQRISMGVFYVATDGSVMYKFDAVLDDFAEITE